MKKFEVKVYDKSGTFKKQINPKNITSDITFTEELNGGQGNLMLSFVGDFDDYSVTDIVEIREVDDENKSITPTYTGIIEEIDDDEYKTTEVVTLSLLGAFTVLNDIEYKDGGSRTFNKSGTPGAIVKLIIDSFNAEYGALSANTQNLTGNIIRYTGSSIDVTGTTVNYSFDKETCLEAIKKVLEGSGMDFFIGADGICYVTQDANQTPKVLTLGREAIQIKRNYHKRDMVNKYYLARNGGTELTYTSAGAITSYGLKEKTESDSDILDQPTQDLLGAKKISDFSAPRLKTEILTKPLQSASIMPGNLLTVQNAKRPITSQKIIRITKSTKGFTVNIGDFVSF